MKDVAPRLEENVHAEKDAQKNASDYKTTDSGNVSAQKKRNLLKKEREICESATD